MQRSLVVGEVLGDFEGSAGGDHDADQIGRLQILMQDPDAVRRGDSVSDPQKKLYTRIVSQRVRWPAATQFARLSPPNSHSR